MGIAAGPDGNLWFTESDISNGAIGRITPDGQILTVAAEHVLTVRAELDVRDRTLRHYDNSHKRGVHAAVTA